jgi:hypothetical protein
MASSEQAETTNQAAEANAKAAEARAGGRDQGRATADQTEMSGDIERLRFEAIRNGRYHLARQGWYERWHRIAMFVVVIGGTAAIAEALKTGQPHSFAWVWAMIPTVAGTVDLLFDFAGKAALHARLQERSYEIVADIELASGTPEAICKRGWASMARIWAQEPKTMRVVEALAYNDTKEGTTEDSKGELLVVSGWAKFWRHVCAWDGLPMPRAKDIKGTA